MSDLVIHTRCLSVRDPWGTYLSMHLSRRMTRPTIIVTIAVRDTSIEIQYPSRRAIRPSKLYILFKFSFFLKAHNTFTTMSQNNANDMFTQIMRIWPFSQHCAIHNNINNESTNFSNHSLLSTHHTQAIIQIVFYYPLFSSLELFNMDKSTHHQVPLLPHIYHKEIHTFHTLNKILEIPLPQSIKNSLWNLSLPLSLNFQLQVIYSNKWPT